MKSLKKLQHTDPEFYQYLKENDKNLLDFKVSDDEDGDSSIDDDDNRHIPNEELEVHIVHDVFYKHDFDYTLYLCENLCRPFTGGQ